MTLIWTPDRRVRVFVSSTMAELAPERAAVRAAIEALHLTPVMFELGARPHPPRALYSAYLEQSDVFVGIYWQCYGWVAPNAQISGLEDEYNLSSKLPRLLYVKEPAPERERKLHELLGRFEADGDSSYRKFSDTEELTRVLADDLAILLSERFGAVEGSAFVPQSTIPTPLTPTIGRRREIAALSKLLRDGTRLVTVTGPGGVGKTRLAITAALDVASDHDRDVFFISLASLKSPRHLFSAIADDVGARLDSPDPIDSLAASLRSRPTILVLDNFEHLCEAAPKLLSLLDQCTSLQMLVTSRHVLRLRAEHEFALGPLEVPAPAARSIKCANAVKLFVDRAVAVNPHFTLTPENEDAVAELCRRLDGLPLAIELAAARLRLLQPDELLERLGSRLDLLASTTADLPDRQRALRATLDWSFDLLTPAEQTLFARLSVFTGGATLVAAESVCADDALPDVLDVMASLLEKSLLVQVPPTSGPGRFQMLHVVRAYAWEQLARRNEAEQLRARHARWFIDLVSLDRMQSGDVHSETLDVEIDNLRGVLEWVLDQRDVAAAVALARRLGPWWWLRGRLSEGTAWLARAEKMAAREAPRSLQHAWLLVKLGHAYEQAGDLERAEHPIRAALEEFAAHGDTDGIVDGKLSLASVLAGCGRLDDAIPMAEEVLAGGRRARDDSIVEWAASILGTFFVARSEYDIARGYQQEARDAAERNGSPTYVAMAHHQLALIELMARHIDSCWQELAIAAAIYERNPHLDGVSYALEVAAGVCLVAQETDAALAAASVAHDLHEKLRLPIWPVLRPLHERLETALRDANRARVAPRARCSDPTAMLTDLCNEHAPQSLSVVRRST
jgi:predicted ATPase